MSGLRKSMLVKLSLFVLAEVSTDRQQLGRRLPSDHQQEGSNLPQHPRILFFPMSAEMTVHMKFGRIKTFSWPQKACNMTASDTRYYEIATGPWSTYFLSAGFMRVSCGLYGPRAGVLCCHRHANTRRLLGQSFEHAPNLSVGEIRVKYRQARAFCWELRAAKIVPRILPARLVRKGVTGAIKTYFQT